MALGYLSIEPGEIEDSSPLSSAYEELLELITRAVAKLYIDWPAEKQEALRKSKLGESFLLSKARPPHLGSLFFPYLHNLAIMRYKGLVTGAEPLKGQIYTTFRGMLWYHSTTRYNLVTKGTYLLLTGT